VSEALAASRLDRGERESIELAVTLTALLLIDDERGREAARQLGVTVRGTLGVLIEAYRAGLISADQLRFYFGQIEERTDIWISPALCHRLLHSTLEVTND
jgi:hypothetical protein